MTCRFLLDMSRNISLSTRKYFLFSLSPVAGRKVQVEEPKSATYKVALRRSCGCLRSSFPAFRLDLLKQCLEWSNWIVPKTADPKSLVVLLCANSSRGETLQLLFLRNMEEEVNQKFMDLFSAAVCLGKPLLDGSKRNMHVWIVLQWVLHFTSLMNVLPFCLAWLVSCACSFRMDSLPKHCGAIFDGKMVKNGAAWLRVVRSKPWADVGAM